MIKLKKGRKRIYKSQDSICDVGEVHTGLLDARILFLDLNGGYLAVDSILSVVNILCTSHSKYFCNLEILIYESEELLASHPG